MRNLRRTGGIRSDEPADFLFKGLHHGWFKREREEADAHAPGVFLLCRAIYLHRDDIRVASRQHAEKRFVHYGIVIPEACVGIVKHDEEVVAGIGTLHNCVDNGLRFGARGGIAGWVVGKIKEDEHLSSQRCALTKRAYLNMFALKKRVYRDECFAETVGVETVFGIVEGISFNLRLRFALKDEAIVAPDFVG